MEKDAVSIDLLQYDGSYIKNIKFFLSKITLCLKTKFSYVKLGIKNENNYFFKIITVKKLIKNFVTQNQKHKNNFQLKSLTVTFCRLAFNYNIFPLQNYVYITLYWSFLPIKKKWMHYAKKSTQKKTRQVILFQSFIFTRGFLLLRYKTHNMVT